MAMRIAKNRVRNMAKKKTEEETKKEEVDDSRPNASTDTHDVEIETNWKKIGKDPDAMFPALMEMVSGILKGQGQGEMPKTIMVSFERKSGMDTTHLTFNTANIEEAAVMVKKAMELLPTTKVTVLTTDDYRQRDKDRMEGVE